MQTSLRPCSESAIYLNRNKTVIPFDKILRVEGRGNYTAFILKNNIQVLASKTLSFYEPKLPSHFLKIRKGRIINCSYILLPKYKRINEIRMIDGVVLEVARRYRLLVKKYLVKWYSSIYS